MGAMKKLSYRWCRSRLTSFGGTLKIIATPPRFRSASWVILAIELWVHLQNSDAIVQIPIDPSTRGVYPAEAGLAQGIRTLKITATRML
ncbi:hypothetical protein D4R75_08920 [bacterium]|nr:MAG: hypothetical protein D4R75_08920 [bacterium]